MNREQQAKEQISQWVFEGKELDEIETSLRESRLAGALSQAAVESEYYAARTARKVNPSSTHGKKTARVVGVLALLVGVCAFFVPFYLGALAASARLPIFLLAASLVLLGLLLLFKPERAFED